MGRAVVTVALHGFLGAAADWDSVRQALPSLDWKIPDYVKDPLLAPDVVSLGEWGPAFRRWLSREKIATPIDLVGYSQGGRLALHALAEDPAAFRRVILVSANPGLATSADRSARIGHDEAWASRFEKASWEQVMRDWNALPVFAGVATPGALSRPEPVRPETSEARRIAAASLRNWSVAVQIDFRVVMPAWKDKLVFVAGALDTKYAETTKALADEGFRTHIVKNSGHRVLFDAPEALAKIISG